MHMDGQDIPKNAKAAVKWYSLTSDQGYAEAQFCLAEAYIQGEGVPKNDEKGFH